MNTSHERFTLEEANRLIGATVLDRSGQQCGVVLDHVQYDGERPEQGYYLMVEGTSGSSMIGPESIKTRQIRLVTQ